MNNNFLVTVLRKFENRKIVRKLRKRIYFQNTGVEKQSGRFYKTLRNFFFTHKEVHPEHKCHGYSSHRIYLVQVKL